LWSQAENALLRVRVDEEAQPSYIDYLKTGALRYTITTFEDEGFVCCDIRARLWIEGLNGVMKTADFVWIADDKCWLKAMASAEYEALIAAELVESEQGHDRVPAECQRSSARCAEPRPRHILLAPCPCLCFVLAPLRVTTAY
jgi:hypothetical protein